MSAREEKIDKLIEEELSKLIQSKEIDEGFLDKIKGLGKKGLAYLTKPRPNASQGVGAALAAYNINKKNSRPPKQTGMVKVPRPNGPDGKEDEYEQGPFPDGKRVKDVGRLAGADAQKALPAHSEPLKPNDPQKRLEPHKGNEPLMLKEPDEIVTSSEIGATVQPDDLNTIARLINKYIRDIELQSLSINQDHIKLVLGYLIANNRILVNPTRVPSGTPEEQDAEIVSEIVELPSMQQADLEFDSLDSWIQKLHYSFKKDRNIDIPVINLYSIIMTVYKDGRLAISPQKARRMGVELNNKNTKRESLNYETHYDAWKQHTRAGVII